MIPRFDGVILSLEWQEAQWDKFVIGAPRPRTSSELQYSALAQLSKELGINPKTFAKWRKRSTVEYLKTGPKEPQSTVLTEAEEAMIVAFRRHKRRNRFEISSAGSKTGGVWRHAMIAVPRSSSPPSPSQQSSSTGYES